MTWKVQISAKVEREIVKLVKSGQIGREDQIVLRDWILFVEKNGPDALTENSLWNDHALTRDDKWNGCRSSSYSYSGRIIYKIIDGLIIVEVLRISPNHDYT
jgi:mRNA-degrading endonuclease RelE of RelBE toxin-antitoxin system